MYRRQRMSRTSSRRRFTRGAVLSHKKNFRSNPLRGGIRL